MSNKQDKQNSNYYFPDYAKENVFRRRKRVLPLVIALIVCAAIVAAAVWLFVFKKLDLSSVFNFGRSGETVIETEEETVTEIETQEETETETEIESETETETENETETDEESVAETESETNSETETETEIEEADTGDEIPM